MNRMSRPTILAGALATLLLWWVPATELDAGPGIWTSNGPDGGWVLGLAASPFTANEVYAVSRGGVFRSVDGGVTWSDRSAGINRQVFNIVHSQTAIGRLMVGGATKLFFSDDAAATWQDRTPAPGLLSAASMGRLEVSPTLAGTYYVALDDGRVLWTSDSGLSWNASPAVPQPGDFFITSIAADPAAPGEVLIATETDFAASDHRVYRGNLTLPPPPVVWTEIACAAGCPWDTQALRALKFGSAGRVWASGGQGTARSDDGGATWVATPASPSTFNDSIAINPSDNTEVYLAGGEGVQYTTDDGATWTHVASGFAGNDLLQTATSTVVVYKPFDTSRQLVGTNSNGVYRRNALPPIDSFVPGITGFNAQNIRAVASNVGNKVHAGVGDSFGATYVSFRSTNNGLTWPTANSGLAADQFRALVVDPNDSDTLYAGGLFRPKPDGMGGTDPGNGGIYKSDDGGLTWTTIDNGIPQTMPPFQFSLFGTVRDIAVDPFSAGPMGDSQVLYAVGSGRYTSDGMGGFTQEAARVYKSVDAGATWVASDSGIGSGETGASGRVMYASGVQIVVDTADLTGNTLYMATFIGRGDGDVPMAIDNGVFRTIDGGATWSNVTNGLPRVNGVAGAAAADVLSLAYDPTDPTGQTLYASTNDLSNSVLGTVYKTIDGGLNWTFSGTGLANRDVRDLVVDPLTGDVYAGIADPLGNGDGGVFVSDDGGTSWSSISTGFPGAAVGLKLELDNTGSNLLIHAGTTRSVQSFEVVPDGDTDGATNPIEEGAPNAGDGNGDGVQDRDQAVVASPQVLDPFRGTSSYITAELTGLVGACPGLENSFGLDLLDDVPVEAAMEATFSGLHLRIPDCEEAEIALTYHDPDAEFSDPSYRIRAYGLAFPDEDTTAWFDLAPASVAGITWTFTVADGAIGDATPDDGVIVFQGAAKRLREAFFADSMEAE